MEINVYARLYAIAVILLLGLRTPDAPFYLPHSSDSPTARIVFELRATLMLKGQ
jgi:hypothetical protein